MADTRHQNYNYIKRGELTQAAREKILEEPFATPVDDEPVTIEDLQRALELEERSPFPEGVAKRLQELGVDCTEENTALLAQEVKTRYKQRIGEPDESTWKTLKKWINGQKTSVVNRETNYNLCYALNMDLKETETFFIKYFHSGAFNYKNAIDAIYFYCIHNSRPYSTIKRMLETAGAFDDTNTAPADTVQIGLQIKDIDDDDEFLWFLSKHCYNRKQQYQRARTAIINKMNSIAKDVPRCIDELESLNLTVDIFDLDKQQPESLQNYDVVEFIGGNPFYLLNSIRATHAADILKDIAAKKVLIGWSAAAFVFSPTLELVNCYSPEMNFLGLTDLTGLALTEIEVLPHYSKFIKRFEQFKEKCCLYEKEHNTHVIRINDGDGIFIDSDDIVVCYA